MALVDYGSDSDSGSPPPAPAAVKATLPPVAPGSDDDQDDDVDPADAFGIAKLDKEEQSKAATAGQSAVAVRSAPDVMANVSINCAATLDGRVVHGHG